MLRTLLMTCPCKPSNTSVSYAFQIAHPSKLTPSTHNINPHYSPSLGSSKKTAIIRYHTREKFSAQNLAAPQFRQPKCSTIPFQTTKSTITTKMCESHTEVYACGHSIHTIKTVGGHPQPCANLIKRTTTYAIKCPGHESLPKK